MGHYDEQRDEYDANPAEYLLKCEERYRESQTEWWRQVNALKENERLRAENARLRAALEQLARLGSEPHYGNSVGNEIARAALEVKP
jgi:hypothetical protein